jgi:hypothetical protein
MEIEAQLNYALKKAQAAVSFDSEDAYSEALDAYRESITAMENILAKSDEEWLNDNMETQVLSSGMSDIDRRRIIELRNTYVERVDTVS